MVVAILAVLWPSPFPTSSASARPPRTGRRTTDLRNVLLAEKMIWLEDGAYTADLAVLNATRPGSLLNADPAAGCSPT